MKRLTRVFMGESRRPVGTLAFTAEGNRTHAAFRYDGSWLDRPDRFEIDPGLPLVANWIHHAKGRSDRAPDFFGCFADSEPDGWGVRVIRRDYARRRNEAEREGRPIGNSPLNSLDFLLYVDDACRIGALRFQDESGDFVRAPPPGMGTAPPLIELRMLLNASRAVENGTETAADLRYLLGKGTSVGGMRPKCSVIDDDGALCIGKFPSDTDSRSVTKGEVLALKLARLAGIDAADARIVTADGVPVTLVRRFDRVGDRRLMYASARTMLGIDDDREHAYTEIVNMLRQRGEKPERDAEELWRRVVFGILITNVDDHLNNHGFIHVRDGRWSLSPAFDINPFPDKARVLKTWISEDTGADARVEYALKAAPHFGLDGARSREVLRQVLAATEDWRQVATSGDVGMTSDEVDHFVYAFHHEERQEAIRAVRQQPAAAKPKKSGPRNA